MATVRTIALAYNRVYLVEDGGERVLIDTGPDYRGAFARLLEVLGDRLPDRVISTHGHLDHAGLGLEWSKRDVPVYLHSRDHRLVRRPPVANEGDLARFAAYLEEAGTPPAVARGAMATMTARVAQAGAIYAENGPYVDTPKGNWPTALRYPPFRPLAAEEMGAAAGLAVISSPGHTDGNIVVAHAESGLLFSGDQLLPDITPTPSLQFAEDGSRVHSLVLFHEGLERLAERNWATCYPGHGDVIARPNEVIRANIQQIEERAERILRALKESPATVYGIAMMLYPRVTERRPLQILATIQGHLDLLAARMLVQRESDGQWNAV